ncbi:PEP-CTERM sorting domain-containing protein [Thalassotalea atypica]|uniref:PEP-CTERM sorting domain-containing protein n=1 Tax=Thalassotalea atypica TaxID=2054316 RepID=UPI002573EC8C|nr:PEP-CTERM sorting domain-containing protein [Thalassotalea atypica]
MINKIKTALFTLTTITALSANAGLVTQHTSVQTYQRSCPGVADANWVKNWKPIVEWYYGIEQADADLMCHFNGGNQERHFNSDGTPKDANWRYDDAWPTGENGEAISGGGEFTAEQVGTLEIIASAGPEDMTTVGTKDGKYYAQVTLDDENLGLPEIKVKSESDEFERNSVNAFAATEYLWTGEDETLEFTANFDFFASGGAWALGDTPEINDYLLGMEIGVATDMLFDVEQIFPTDWGNQIATAGYNTNNEPRVSGSLEEPIEGTVTVSFDVSAGDQFFLYGWIQAFGYNGGFVDASNTLTSQLAVQGQTQQQSQQIFAAALQAAPPSDPNAIPEPSSLFLALLGFIGLAGRKKILG